MTDLALTTTESAELAHLEGIVERNMKSFIEAGQALMRLRDGRLYRAQYSTFEDYCQERWAFSRQRAAQLISASEVALNLSTTVAVPNERIARALGKLDNPQAQRLALTTAIATAPEGKLTAEWVEGSVDVMIDALATEGLVDTGKGEWAAMNSAITTEVHHRMIEKRKQIQAGKQKPLAVLNDVLFVSRGDDPETADCVALRISRLTDEEWIALSTGELCRVIVYSVT